MKTLTIDQDRLTRIMQIPLLKGAHESPPNGTCEVCVMEAYAYVTCQKHSDRNVCASPIIESFLRGWNDSLNDDDRNRLLKQFIPKLVNVKGGKDLEGKRFWMLIDWLIRDFTPEWLRAAKLNTEADVLSALAQITDIKGIEASARAIQLAKEKAAAAGDAARDAARAAAGAAARDAARAAAGAAAGDAARDAAWDAARAAAGDAAKKSLRPTVEKLQASAVQLLDRLVAVE